MFFGEKNPGLFVRRAVVRRSSVGAASSLVPGFVSGAAGATAAIGAVVFRFRVSGATRSAAVSAAGAIGRRIDAADRRRRFKIKQALFPFSIACIDKIKIL